MSTNTRANATGNAREERVLDQKSAPIFDVTEMFHHMVEKIVKGPHGAAFKRTLSISVATVCSGTDAPIFALQLIEKAALALNVGSTVQVNHLYSCEIEPFKQAFIRRNVPSSVVIFRDVVEMAVGVSTGDGTATTAGGYRARIPTDGIDIFFAGCSCVDFSCLNKDKKDLEPQGIDKYLDMRNIPKEPRPVRRNPEFARDLLTTIRILVSSKNQGESTRTFFGAVVLISTSRPGVVILENVEGAPWNAYTNVIFPELGYAARWVKLDTKDYYLPQTRSRGYLIAVDADRFQDPSQAQDAVDAWVESMKLCKQMPSAPVTSFLRAPDDPATVQARFSMEIKEMSISNAAISLLRHDKVRFQQKITNADHPFSMMEVSHGRIVNSSFPSQSWQRYWAAQVLRVSDVMDLAVAAGLKVGVDIRYKPYLIDVSQNTDRLPMVANVKNQGKKVGLIGCITPAGQPIVSNLMRPLTGTEVMALQGMPVDEMTITTESQKNLQDLAGNAMTVTVVGAAALSILVILGAKAPAFWTVVPPDQVKNFPGVYLNATKEDSLLASIEARPFHMHGSFRELCDIAKRARRLCYCRYVVEPRDESKQTYMSCAHCGATACAVCRGNPIHSYDVDKNLRQELTSDEAKVQLSSLLPPVFSLKGSSGPINRLLAKASHLRGDREYRDVVQKIFADGSVFYFQEINCTEVVTVCYRSKTGIARLVLSETSATLYIYVAPNHPSREMLLEVFDFDQPVARISLRVHEDDEIKWDLWVNRKIDLTLPVVMNEVDSSFEFGELSFVDGLDPQHAPALSALKRHVQRHLSGKFLPKPGCGTARDALRVRKGSPRVFFMLHPTACGDPSLDSFVITLDCRKLDLHDYREVLLTIDPSEVILDQKTWKVPLRTSGEVKILSVFWRGYWASCDPVKISFPLPEHPRSVFGKSTPITTSPCPQSKNPSPEDTATLAVVKASVPFLHISESDQYRIALRNIEQGSAFFTVPPTELNSFLKKFAFAGIGVKDGAVPVDDEESQYLRGHWIDIQPCDHCCVEPPLVHFIGKDIFEDVGEARAYEQAILSQPRPVHVGACFDKARSKLEVVVRLVPPILPSKALVHLRQAHGTLVRGRRALAGEAKTSLTVELGHQWQRSVELATLTAFLRPCGGGELAGIDLAALAQLEPALQVGGTLQPPGFINGHQLLPGQEDAVRWMVWREVAPLPFTERETEEEVVRADKTSSVDERVEIVEALWREELGMPFGDMVVGWECWPFEKSDPGALFIHLSATLIAVPAHITGQWASEAKKFLGLGKPQVLVIKTPDQWLKTGRVALEKARLIIISTGFFDETDYRRQVEMLAARPDPEVGSAHVKAGRELDALNLDAARNSRIINGYFHALQARGQSEDDASAMVNGRLLPQLRSIADARRQTLLRQAQAAAQSGRKKARQAGNATGKPLSTRKEKKAEEDTGDARRKVGSGKVEAWDSQWIHNFSFARFIWDECSYEHPRLSAFAEHVGAGAKWFLSGTPRLATLRDVCGAARLFGIHIARPEPQMAPGLPSSAEGPVLSSMSKSEEFRALSAPLRSIDMAVARHEQGRAFVEAFGRANTVAGRRGEVEEIAILVSMEPQVAYQYHVAFNDVTAACGDMAALRPQTRDLLCFRDNDVRGGCEPSDALLVMVAAGLSEHTGSIGRVSAMHQRRLAEAERLYKILSDKAVFLACWLAMLEPAGKAKKAPTGKGKELVTADDDDDEDEEGNAKITAHGTFWDTFLRIKAWALEPRAALKKADMQGRSHQSVARIARLLSNAHVEGPWGRFFSIPGSLRNLHELAAKDFKSETWKHAWRRENALYSWPDFYQIDDARLKSLRDHEVEELAHALRLLCHRHAPSNDPNAPLDPAYILSIAGQNSRRLHNSRVSVPDARIVPDGSQGARTVEDHRRIVKRWASDRPPKPVMRGADRREFQGKTKAKLQEMLAERNVTFKANDTVNALQERIWNADHGILDVMAYRDNRAFINLWDEFPPHSAANKDDNLVKAVKDCVVQLVRAEEEIHTGAREGRAFDQFIHLTRHGLHVGADHGGGHESEHRYCDACFCPLLSLSTAFQIITCGHILCLGCKLGLHEYCAAPSCNTLVTNRTIIRCSEIVRCTMGQYSRPQAVVKLVKEIPEEDFILIFAQHRPMIEAINRELQQIHPPFPFTTLDADASKSLEKFKEKKGGRVLLLDIDSDASAGSNLTVANHIIFASPYMHPDPDHRDMVIRQAKGRCDRNGQTKKVKIYNFIARDTIEEKAVRERLDTNPGLEEAFAIYVDDVPWWNDTGVNPTTPKLILPPKLEDYHERKEADQRLALRLLPKKTPDSATPVTQAPDSDSESLSSNTVSSATASEAYPETGSWVPSHDTEEADKDLYGYEDFDFHTPPERLQHLSQDDENMSEHTAKNSDHEDEYMPEPESHHPNQDQGTGAPATTQLHPSNLEARMGSLIEIMVSSSTDIATLGESFVSHLKSVAAVAEMFTSSTHGATTAEILAPFIKGCTTMAERNSSVSENQAVNTRKLMALAGQLSLIGNQRLQSAPDGQDAEMEGNGLSEHNESGDESDDEMEDTASSEHEDSDEEMEEYDSDEHDGSGDEEFDEEFDEDYAD
ncbi:hypothetical protein QBC34DRAFT_495705 [Podospora aff. communis PSN243]|uniref:Helicase C-terminal domain-containing protein n=1 Tax=Podospora aff. communis PSN243 TaxID=3040156 RepID=A0AAV9GH74_9PEZI|nr:hypothetical protein QBC34DRAFT_495705 [Podospora aff. communis PSN243]